MEKYENIMDTLKNSKTSYDDTDCFFQLIEGVDAESLDNLINMMVEYYGKALTKKIVMKCFKTNIFLKKQEKIYLD